MRMPHTRLRVPTVTYLWLATCAACVEFAGHPSDEAAVFYPNLPECADSGVGDFENLPVTRHVAEGGREMKLRPDKI